MALAVTLAVLVSGCAEEHRAPPPTVASTLPTRIPAYDGSLPPAQAVQALVPLRVRRLTVVDLDQVRAQLGLPELTSRSSAAGRSAFRTRAAVAAPLLDPFVLGRVDEKLRSTFGFGVDDEAWEAHLGRAGWVVAFRDGADMEAVARAVAAGIGPLRGATVDVGDHLLTHDVAGPGEQVWAADPTWSRLVPEPGEAFLVQRGCLDAAGGPPGPGLRPLDGFAVTFGDHVATVRVDRDRSDLFARVRRGSPAFDAVFRHGVADPSSGRIGYDVPRPARVAALVRRSELPFGVCAPGH